MTYQHLYKDAEWMVLEAAPLFVFYIVAGIDKNIDSKEVSEFVDQVVAAPSHSRTFGQEVFTGLQSDLKLLLEVASKADWIAGLRAVHDLLTRVPSAEADDFKASLVLIGDKVSQSSGGFLQAKASEDEKKAILLVVAILEGQV